MSSGPPDRRCIIPYLDTPLWLLVDITIFAERIHDIDSKHVEPFGVTEGHAKLSPLDTVITL